MINKTVCIPIFGGIGNIIQTLPFAFAMKMRYARVNAYIRGINGTKEVMHIVRSTAIFNRIYKSYKAIPGDQKIFRHAERRSFPEWKAWFVDNKEPIPADVGIPRIGYAPMNEEYDVIIWPECKGNWPCKKWPYQYYQNLIDIFHSTGKSIAVVGVDKSPNYTNATDYRGKISLLETGGLIKNAKMFIGNEGGISHYAAALKVPTFIILGCSDPVKNMPLMRNAHGISKNLDCQPCQFKRSFKINKKKNPWKMEGCLKLSCLRELTPDEVSQKIMEAMR